MHFFYCALKSILWGQLNNLFIVGRELKSLGELDSEQKCKWLPEMPHHEANFLQLWLRHLTGDTGAKLRRSNYFFPRKGGKGIIYSVPSILYALYINMHQNFYLVLENIDYYHILVYQLTLYITTYQFLLLSVF